MYLCCISCIMYIVQTTVHCVVTVYNGYLTCSQSERLWTVNCCIKSATCYLCEMHIIFFRFVIWNFVQNLHSINYRCLNRKCMAILPSLVRLRTCQNSKRPPKKYVFWLSLLKLKELAKTPSYGRKISLFPLLLFLVLLIELCKSDEYRSTDVGILFFICQSPR